MARIHFFPHLSIFSSVVVLSPMFRDLTVEFLSDPAQRHGICALDQLLGDWLVFLRHRFVVLQLAVSTRCKAHSASGYTKIEYSPVVGRPVVKNSLSIPQHFSSDHAGRPPA
jgi:hypothetical protein